MERYHLRKYPAKRPVKRVVSSSMSGEIHQTDSRDIGEDWEVDLAARDVALFSAEPAPSVGNSGLGTPEKESSLDMYWSDPQFVLWESDAWPACSSNSFPVYTPVGSAVRPNLISQVATISSHNSTSLCQTHTNRMCFILSSTTSNTVPLLTIKTSSILHPVKIY